MNFAIAADELQRRELARLLWQEESDRDELAPGILDFLDLLEQAANEIEQAAGASGF